MKGSDVTTEVFSSLVCVGFDCSRLSGLVPGKIDAHRVISPVVVFPLELKTNKCLFWVIDRLLRDWMATQRQTGPWGPSTGSQVITLAGGWMFEANVHRAAVASEEEWSGEHVFLLWMKAARHLSGHLERLQGRI